MARTPLANEELNEQVKIRYEIDELKAIQLMGDQGSVACETYGELGLSRAVEGLALDEPADSRAWQVALCSILFATRFKCLVEGKFHRTSCGLCGARDDHQHLLDC